MNLRTIFVFISISFIYLECSAQPYRFISTLPFPDSLSRGFSPCEPSICINPKDEDNIVVGTILDRIYWTHDKGRNWNVQRVTSTYGVYGDPVVICDSSGIFYFFHLSDPKGTNWKSEEILDRIVCQKSEDGGKTWNDGTYVGLNHPHDQDKEWAIIDPLTNDLVVSWTEFDTYGDSSKRCQSNILLSRSHDAGKSWDTPTRVNEISGNCLDGDETVEGAVAAITKKGDLGIVWAGNGGVYFDLQKREGGSWYSNDIKVTKLYAGWELDIAGFGRANGMPVLKTAWDYHNGNGIFYINWADKKRKRFGSDVWLSKSYDKGLTWSKPVTINQDRTNTDQFFTWMSVDNNTGYLYFVYYSSQDSENQGINIVMARSEDEGEAFEELQLNRYPFTPNSDVFFGDYNTVYCGEETLALAWTITRFGRTRVQTFIATYDEIDILFGERKNDFRRK